MHCLAAVLPRERQASREVGQPELTIHGHLHSEGCLRVEALKLGIFGCTELLADEVVSSQVQGQANHTNAGSPQPRHGDEEHEEVQPPLVRKGHAEDLGPEPVSGHHRVSLFGLGRIEGAEGVTAIAIFEEGVLDRGTMNGSEQGRAKDTSDSHHVEWVQGPVVEALEEEDESEDPSHTEAWREEPPTLAQRVDQEH